MVQPEGKCPGYRILQAKDYENLRFVGGIEGKWDWAGSGSELSEGDDACEKLASILRRDLGSE